MNEFEWNNLYNKLLADYEARGVELRKLNEALIQERGRFLCEFCKAENMIWDEESGEVSFIPTPCDKHTAMAKGQLSRIFKNNPK